MKTFRVAVRLRDIKEKNVNVKIEEASNEIFLYKESNEIPISFNFDKIFGGDTNQCDLYNNCVRPLVGSLFEGINATILAYGQTGSGKSYTMGTHCIYDKDSDNFGKNGIIPKLIEDIF